VLQLVSTMAALIKEQLEQALQQQLYGEPVMAHTPLLAQA